MQEPLRVILAAEEDARRRLEAAQQEARALVAAAEDEVRRARAAAEAAREGIATATAEALLDAARAEAARLREDGAAAIRRMQTVAAAHTDAAIDAVLALVIPKGVADDE